MSLKLDWCNFKAAKYACEHWHYSKSVPAGKLTKIGVWENDKFIGCILFGRGANNNANKYFKVGVTECCELVRIALTKHKTPVSRIVSIALKIIKKYSPGLKLVFSYSDITNQNHEGIIYRAGNWKYLGIRTSIGGHWIYRGKLLHNRSAVVKWGCRKNYPKELLPAPPQKKHLFVYYLRW